MKVSKRLIKLAEELQVHYAGLRRVSPEIVAGLICDFINQTVIEVRQKREIRQAATRIAELRQRAINSNHETRKAVLAVNLRSIANDFEKRP